MRVSRHGMLLPFASLLIGCAAPRIVAEPAATLRYADLDLASPADRAELAGRVDAAALRLCDRIAAQRRLPPHYSRAHPRACLAPARKAFRHAMPEAARAALR